MIFSKRLSLVVLCLGLATVEPMQARRYRTVTTTVTCRNTDDIDLGKLALYTAGIGLIVYGIYSLYNYLHVSNQQLVEDTQILLYQAKRYHSLSNILLKQQISDENILSEELLDTIAKKIGTAVAISRYISELDNLKSDIDTKIRKINKRKIKLTRKVANSNGACSSKIEDQRLLDAMLALELASQPVLRDLNLLSRCLNKHAGYLELAQNHTIFNRKYHLEISALNSEKLNNLKQLARAAVASEHVLYPLLQYSRMLKNDTTCLALALSNLRFHYPILTNQAQELQDQMGQIYRLIVSDSEYVAEQNARREAEQREERLRIERERLEIEREKIWIKATNPPAQQTVVIHNH